MTALARIKAILDAKPFDIDEGLTVQNVRALVGECESALAEAKAAKERIADCTKDYMTMRAEVETWRAQDMRMFNLGMETLAELADLLTDAQKLREALGALRNVPGVRGECSDSDAAFADTALAAWDLKHGGGK